MRWQWQRMVVAMGVAGALCLPTAALASRRHKKDRRTDCPEKIEAGGRWAELRDQVKNYLARPDVALEFLLDMVDLKVLVPAEAEEYIVDLLQWMANSGRLDLTLSDREAFERYTERFLFSGEERRRLAVLFFAWANGEAVASPGPASEKKPVPSPAEPKPKPVEEPKPVKEAEKYESRDVKELRALLAEKSDLAEAARDFVTYRWMYKFSRTGLVTLMLGNPWSRPTDEELRETATLVTQLRKDGFRILYDADTPYAPVIAELGGDSALGVTSRAEVPEGLRDRNIVRIRNPYVRLQAFGSTVAQALVTGPDSFTGLGLMVETDGAILWDPRGRWTHGGAQSWGVALNRMRKGYLSNKEVRQTGEQTELLRFLEKGRYSSYYSSKEETIPRYDEAAATGRLDHYDIDRLMRFARGLVNGKQRLERDAASGQPIPGGAVLFGSSTEKEEYGDLVYRTQFALGKLGIPVTTGGAGGLMGVANAGAFNAGAHSIGIPVTHLWKEKNVPREHHTLTIETDDYEVRIPLLLYRRRLVQIAPGSSGTLKELATTLVLMGDPDCPRGRLVFIGSKIYRDIVDGLRRSALPSTVLGRIELVDSTEQIVALAQALQRELGDTASELGTFRAAPERGQR